MPYLLKLFTLVSLSAAVCGCSTMRESILLGSGVGLATGGATGYIVGGHTTQGTVIGAVLGAATGGALGYLLRKKEKNQDSTPQPVNISSSKIPYLTKPNVQILWVPDKIEGNKYIEGHFIYVIDKQSAWSKE